MNQKAKFLLLIFTLFLSIGSAHGQEKDSPWSIGMDLASRYIWRGINFGGSSPNIQPHIEYNFGSENHSFTIGAWGAYSLNGTQTGQEADLYLTYTVKEVFSVTLTDYFLLDEESDNYNYFNYNTDWEKIDDELKDQTSHIVEAILSFNGTDNFPLSIMFAINIWGADSRKYEDQSGTMVPVDKIVMSKYLELGYSTDINKLSINLFAGLPLDIPNTENGEPVGFYGQTGTGLTNLGIKLSKELAISNTFTLPVSASFITNPEAGNVFIVFGMSF